MDAGGDGGEVALDASHDSIDEPVADANDTCPATEPASGAACVQPKGAFGCTYPLDDSGCNTQVCVCAGAGAWKCEQGLECVDGGSD